jgi:uncharacterized protein
MIRLILLGMLIMVTSCLSAAANPPADEVLAIPMRDGALLATDLYLPPGFSEREFPKGIPVILICTPYDKSRRSPIDAWRACLLRNGYAVAVQDMRGYYASANPDDSPIRRYDGHDSVVWLARQHWCSGKVGMMGYSHLGAAQYEAAVTAPPSLACAIPAQAPGNYYTDALYPPVFRKADMETILRGPFTSRIQPLLNRRARSARTRVIEQFNTPMLHIAGWYDPFLEGAIEMFAACQQHAGPRARGNQKLIIGPWPHGVLQEQNPGAPLQLPGGLTYPPNSKLDWENDVWLPWFDHWLKGNETGVMHQPAVRYYLMGAVNDPDAPGNIWITADTFPPESTAVTYFAHPDSTLRTQAPAEAEGHFSYQFDPRDPVPTVGRRHARVRIEGPYDQRETQGRQDVIVFTTEPLERPLAIVGRVRVTLWASSDRKDTDFTAMLMDVYPDGRAFNFMDSIVKGRYRNTFHEEEFLEPGRPYEFEIDLGHIALALAPGHRLRLAISSSNFDQFDINPNTGEPYGDHALTRELLQARLQAEPRRHQ